MLSHLYRTFWQQTRQHLVQSGVKHTLDLVDRVKDSTCVHSVQPKGNTFCSQLSYTFSIDLDPLGYNLRSMEKNTFDIVEPRANMFLMFLICIKFDQRILILLTLSIC